MKADFANSLLSWLFKGEDVSEAEYARMFKEMTWGSSKEPACPAEVLAALEKMDFSDRSDFKHVEAALKNQKAVQEELRKVKGPSLHEGAYEKKYFTPSGFKALLAKER